jgi:hypothetical protein
MPAKEGERVYLFSTKHSRTKILIEFVLVFEGNKPYIKMLGANETSIFFF